MHTAINIIGSFMDSLNNIAKNISQTFTGADSGAILVMVIFYLLSIILIVLLCKGLIAVLKSLFTTKSTNKRSNKKNVTQSTKQENAADIVAAGTNPGVDPRYNTLTSFDVQTYLEVLSLKHDKLQDIPFTTDVLQPLVVNLPQQAAIPEAVKPYFTAEEVEALSTSIAGKDLMALRKILSESRTTELRLLNQSVETDKKLASVCAERNRLVSVELAEHDAYNLGINNLTASREKWTAIRERLEAEYLTLLRSISEIGLLRAELLNRIEQVVTEIRNVPVLLQAFDSKLETELVPVFEELHRYEASLREIKERYALTNGSRVKLDKELAELQAERDSQHREKFILSETCQLLQTEIANYELLEAERRAKEEADRLAHEEAVRLAREEEERRAQEEARRQHEEQAHIASNLPNTTADAVDSGSDAEPELKDVPSSAEVDAVRNLVEKQANTAYVLNFDDISPEMYEKIAAARRNKPTTPAKEGPSGPKGGLPCAANNTPTQNPATTNDGGKADTEDDTDNSAQEPNYISELQKQWAAERAHREKWRAEQAEKEAEIQRRRNALSGEERAGAAAVSEND